MTRPGPTSRGSGAPRPRSGRRRRQNRRQHRGGRRPGRGTGALRRRRQQRQTRAPYWGLWPALFLVRRALARRLRPGRCPRRPRHLPAREDVPEAGGAPHLQGHLRAVLLAQFPERGQRPRGLVAEQVLWPLGFLSAQRSAVSSSRSKRSRAHASHGPALGQIVIVLPGKNNGDPRIHPNPQSSKAPGAGVGLHPCRGLRALPAAPTGLRSSIPAYAALTAHAALVSQPRQEPATPERGLLGAS